MSFFDYHEAISYLNELVWSNNSSTENLIDLLNNVDGKVPGASNSDVFLLQSGHLMDGSHVTEAGGKLMDQASGNLHDIGSSHIGRFLNSITFFRALRDAVAREDFALANYQVGNDAEKTLVNQKTDLLVYGLDENKNRVSNTSLWDIASQKYVTENNGNWRIIAGIDVSDSSVLMQTEIPALLSKQGDFDIDGLSKNAIVAMEGGLETHKSTVLTSAIAQTIVSRISSTDTGIFLEMSPKVLSEMLGDADTVIDGKTSLQHLESGMGSITGDAKTRFDLAKMEVMENVGKLAKTFPMQALSKFGMVFGALGLVVAGQESAQAAQNGDHEQAKDIMVEYAAETVASEVAGKLAGTIALIGVAAATAAGVTISAPVAAALVIGATLLGGFFGGDVVKPWLEYLKDRDANGRMDALDKFGKLIFGDNYGQLHNPPQELLDNQLALQSGAISHAIGEQVTLEAIVQNAKDSIAWRYALKHLNAFVVEGVDYAPHNQDGSLDLYNPATGEGAMSEAYLSARAAMLAWKIRFDRGRLDSNDFFPHNGPKPYDEDWDTNTVEGNWDFVDLGTVINGKPLQLSIDGNGISLHDHQIVFGTDASETLEGSGDNDQLLGGKGNDTLKGFDGDDYLEGGAGDDTLKAGVGKNILIGGKGNDTYIIENDGQTDTIIDSDGQGKIQLGDTVISGSFGPVEGTTGPDYFTEDKQYKLTQINAKDWHLFANTNGNYTQIALLKNWKSGDLGLDTNGEPVPPPRYDMDLSHLSSYLNIDATASPLGVVMVGNDKSNSFTGSSHSDVIITGDGQQNYVMAGDGNNLIAGGSGRDFIRSGTNAGSSENDNDVVQAGEGTDMVYGGKGEDQIWGNHSTADNFTTQADSHERGDWLSGEDGNDTVIGSHKSDMIFGGAGADTLLGGAGNDLILGDAKYSVSSGVMAIDWAPNTASWIWSDAHNGFIGPLKQNDYWKSTLLVPKGAIHEWSWQLDDYHGFVINLAPGITWLSEVRADPAGGNDLIDAGEGDDFIDGQLGDDEIYGGKGNDILHGNLGNDQLYGNEGNDRLYGGEGDDVMNGGKGIDTLYGGQGNDTYHITWDSTTCIDSGGYDTYVIYWVCLQDGATATIQDSDGWGNLVFDGWYINNGTVVATGENEWRIQGSNGQGILTQQGNDLHITAEGATGNVVVQNFFSQDNFLNLTLPEYNPQMQNLALNGTMNTDTLADNVFIDPYDGFQDAPMLIDLIGTVQF